VRENDPGRWEPCRLRHRPGRHSRVHPHTDNATTDTQLVESVKSVAAAQVERITQLVRDLAQTESGSTEGRTLVGRIDEELMMLMELLN
jgi:hypothetical protein